MQIFSPSLWLIFSFFWQCREEIFQSRNFNFIKFQLINSFFRDCAFGVISKKLWPNSRSSRFSPMLSSRNCVILHFPFRSVTYFELIFVKGVSNVLRFFLSMWMSSCSGTICWKDSLLFIILSLMFCQKSVDCIPAGLFLGSWFCSTDLFFCSFTNIILSWSLQLYSKSWSRAG